MDGSYNWGPTTIWCSGRPTKRLQPSSTDLHRRHHEPRCPAVRTPVVTLLMPNCCVPDNDLSVYYGITGGKRWSACDRRPVDQLAKKSDPFSVLSSRQTRPGFH